MKSFSSTNAKNWVLFIVALVITGLFIGLSDYIFDPIAYNANDYLFNDSMYNNNMYLMCALIASLSSWICAILYYWIIDKWDRWFHWIIFMAVAVLAAPTIIFYYLDGVFYDMDLLYYSETMWFSLLCMAATLVLFICVSFLIKGLSRNCSKTPF